MSALLLKGLPLAPETQVHKSDPIIRGTLYHGAILCQA